MYGTALIILATIIIFISCNFTTYVCKNPELDNLSWIQLIKIIVLLVCTISFIKLCANVRKTTEADNTYYLPCELISVHNNTKIFEDENGELWVWEDDRQYDFGSLYLITMNTNNTEDKEDDIMQVVWELAGEKVDNAVG